MSYDANLPTPRDRVRFTLGDISEPPLRPDESYDALLAQFDEPTTIVRMAESLASEYAQNPSSTTVGGVSVSYSTLVQNWQQIAAKYRDAGHGVTTTGSTFSSGTLARPGMTRGRDSEYRRPVDWAPDKDTGDGW